LWRSVIHRLAPAEAMSAQTPHHWLLLGNSTNPHNVTHFTLSRLGESPNGEDYDELIYVLKVGFGAVETGEFCGPYSIHKYLKIGKFNFGLILEDPEMLHLFARDECDKQVMGDLVTKLLEALNGH
jgi:hypothetical protein